MRRGGSQNGSKSSQCPPRQTIDLSALDALVAHLLVHYFFESQDRSPVAVMVSKLESMGCPRPWNDAKASQASPFTPNLLHWD